MAELMVLEQAAEFPLLFTDVAKEKLVAALKDEPAGTFVRVKISGGGCKGFNRLLEFDTVLDPEEDLETIITTINDQHTVLGSEPYGEPGATEQTAKVVVDHMSALYLKGTTLDFVMEKFKEGFSFVGGASTSTCGCGASVAY